LLPENQVIKQFIYYVSMYDTWQWVDKESFAKTLNTYFTLTENNLFVKEMFDLLINNSVTDFRTEFEKNERAMLVVAEREKDIKNTCYRKCNEAKISMFHEYKVASVFCDRYLSDIGNYICQQKPDIDFCMMFTPNGYTISFRSIKDDLNLARMASRLFPQGGGHAKAAGARLTREHFIEMMSNHLL
jgi:oligoribonuclease NrnB/cAMP/cGMP phosphodiesterase (DHH superfamily)